MSSIEDSIEDNMEAMINTLDNGDEIEAIIEGIVDAPDFATIRRLLGELLKCVQADKDMDAACYPPLIEISKDKLERLTNSFTVRNLTNERRERFLEFFSEVAAGYVCSEQPDRKH